MLIIFDFDGTLVDVNKRYYMSFKEPLERRGIKCLSQGEILSLRRKGLSSREIFTKMIKDPEECLVDRNNIIESRRLLGHDRLIPGVRETLNSLRKRGVIIVLATTRKDKDFLDDFLNKESLKFDMILTKENDENSVLELKKKMYMKALQKFKPDEGFVVSDCRVDLEAGKVLGLKTIGVLTGLENEKLLKTVASVVLNSVNDIPDLFFQG